MKKPIRNFIYVFFLIHWDSGNTFTTIQYVTLPNKFSHNFFLFVGLRNQNNIFISGSVRDKPSWANTSGVSLKVSSEHTIYFGDVENINGVEDSGQYTAELIVCAMTKFVSIYCVEWADVYDLSSTLVIILTTPTTSRHDKMD